MLPPMDEKQSETVRERTTSEALDAVLAKEKPNPWSRGMMKLYVIMAIGYLVSTMNGVR